MSLLEQLRSLSLDRVDLDEAVELVSRATSLQATYAQHRIEPPQIIAEAIGALSREIAMKRRDNLLRAKAAAEARVDGLRTKEQQREDAQKDLERINAELAETQ